MIPSQNITLQLEKLRAELPEGVTLVAVSKFHRVEAIAEAYKAGQRDFGESRTQELVAKAAALPSDIRWHFIGHLQTNKVRPTVSHAWLIQSVDSVKLLKAIDREALSQGHTAKVLMQVHVAREETKFGFFPSELHEFFNSRAYETLRATHICGLMAMASNTDDTSRIEADFRQVADLRNQIMELCPDLRGFNTLSMGMSHDWPLAVDCGANMVRVGSTIFGDRS